MNIDLTEVKELLSITEAQINNSNSVAQIGAVRKAILLLRETANELRKFESKLVEESFHNDQDNR